MHVLLVSTFDLSHQPFGLASPAARLRADGIDVATLDLAVEPLDSGLVRGADVIAFFVPMHTATRLALRALPRIRAQNPEAAICCYGLYAPLNEEHLRASGVEVVLGGEFEDGLVRAVRRLRAERRSAQREPVISTARQEFLLPDRRTLPPLARYARLVDADGIERVAGYTEASRGCKHLCRHCPIVPVYGGVFRVVARDVVLGDVRALVAAGATHVTFGDPDFWNGVGHARAIVRELHGDFPELTYDVTIKVEHLLRHAELLPELAATGCAFVTTAAESFDDEVLARLAKGHTRADFARAVGLCREAGLPLTPTFVPFTPWTTLRGYVAMLEAIAELDLVPQVAPVQMTVRLLIPAGSRLLELPEVVEELGEFDAERLFWRWENADPRVDELQRQVETLVASAKGAPRGEVFARIERLARDAAGVAGAGAWSWSSLSPSSPRADRAGIPYLTEPWFC